MRLTNNQIASIAILFMIISLVCNSMIYKSVSIVITGRTATGQLSICLNRPPALSIGCNNEAIVGSQYSCDANASDYDNTLTEGIQSVTFSDNSTLFDIDPTTGLIQFTPITSQVGNHTVTITARDNSTCVNSMDSYILNLIISGYCGDGVCNGNETCISCTEDCGACIESPVSGGGGGGGGGGGAAEREVARRILLEFDTATSKTLLSGEEGGILIKLKNKGEVSLSSISLGIEAYAPYLRLSLSDNFLEKLDVNEEAKLVLNVKSLTYPKAHIGINRYIVTVNANVGYLGYTESVSFVIEIKEREYEARIETEKQMEFVEDLFKENPECLEFEYMVNRARDYYEESDYGKALSLIDSAIQACRDKTAPKKEEEGIEKLAPKKEAADNLLLLIEMIIILVLFIAIFYYYKKRKRI